MLGLFFLGGGSLFNFTYNNKPLFFWLVFSLAKPFLLAPPPPALPPRLASKAGTFTKSDKISAAEFDSPQG